MDNQEDVLIVGAGPVGLSMALMLCKQGIKCRVIDQKAMPTQTSNAIGVNPRTLEIWQTLQIAEEAIKRGNKITKSSYFNSSKLLHQISFAGVESDYKYMLALPQAKTEGLLLEELAKLGIQVEWNTKLIGLVQKSDLVEVTCSSLTDNFTYMVPWVVGCDGYHSSVRELSGLQRSCHDLEQHFLMLDAVLSGPNLTSDQLTVAFHPQGMVFMLPMQDKWRVVVEISHDTHYKDLKAGTPEIFADILNQRYPGIKIEQIDWMSAFYVHECLAESYNKGRIMIAGDAAHSHSPAGGQGMNTGIQDAWNLSWKLAQVIKGQAKVKLLDSYTVERRFVAQGVLKRSGAMTKLAASKNKWLQLVRNFVMQYILKIKHLNASLVSNLVQTNIIYPKSNLINYKQVIKQGYLRHPMQQPSWLIIAKKTINPKGLPEFIKVETWDKFKLPRGFSLCLIRPDGYVAFYARNIAEIKMFLSSNGIGK